MNDIDTNRYWYIVFSYNDRNGSLSMRHTTFKTTLMHHFGLKNFKETAKETFELTKKEMDSIIINFFKEFDNKEDYENFKN